MARRAVSLNKINVGKAALIWKGQLTAGGTRLSFTISMKKAVQSQSTFTGEDVETLEDCWSNPERKVS